MSLIALTLTNTTAITIPAPINPGAFTTAFEPFNVFTMPLRPYDIIQLSRSNSFIRINKELTAFGHRALREFQTCIYMMIDLLSQHLHPCAPDFLERLPIVMQHLHLPIPCVLSIDFSIRIDYLNRIYPDHMQAMEAWSFFQQFGQDTLAFMTQIANCMVQEGIAQDVQAAMMLDGTGKGLFLKYYPSITWKNWDETGNPCRTLITTNNDRTLIPYVPNIDTF
jgi:hypothetical protein